ncbi:hypothetical protein Y032_0081g1487 [Ancylostoma ceylanicum]|uniref:Uncharacterized protein n=1 Tax=Ancylostoma ceylanicum TaxID=53326 RepID=A0A016TS92_9BILA|nr:hypothetical protein Y032_0081g1487 [Ancylostoma ceylanicum]
MARFFGWHYRQAKSGATTTRVTVTRRGLAVEYNEIFDTVHVHVSPLAAVESSSVCQPSTHSMDSQARRVGHPHSRYQ